MKTISRLHVITNATVEKTITDKKYDDYLGSTRNDMLSLVALPPYELGWNLRLNDKIAVYSHAEGSRRVTTAAEACCSGFMVSGCILKYIVLVSQASPADGTKPDTMSEPDFYGGLPVNLWKIVFKTYGAKGVIDLSAGEGEVCNNGLEETVLGVLLHRPSCEDVVRSPGYMDARQHGRSRKHLPQPELEDI